MTELGKYLASYCADRTMYPLGILNIRLSKESRKWAADRKWFLTPGLPPYDCGKESGNEYSRTIDKNIKF